MIGALIGAAGSVLGGLFGSKKQKVTNEVDYGKMVEKASAAGFNPLTALRNGGAAGFTTTTSPSVSQMPEILGNLGGILGGALENKLDPIQAKRREPDTALLQRQLGTRPAQPAGALYAPRVHTGVKVSQQLVPRLGAQSHKQTASVLPATVKARNENPLGFDQQDAPLTKFGNQEVFKPLPYAPDASSYEDRYGEIAGAGLGFGNLILDGGFNLYRAGKYAYEHYKKSRAQENNRARDVYVPPKKLGGWAQRRPQSLPTGGGW